MKKDKLKSFRFQMGKPDKHGDVIMPGSLYVGADLGNLDNVSGYTLFYDCLVCFGNGCDKCGGTGKSMHSVDSKTAKRYLDHEHSIKLKP